MGWDGLRCAGMGKTSPGWAHACAFYSTQHWTPEQCAILPHSLARPCGTFHADAPSERLGGRCHPSGHTARVMCGHAWRCRLRTAADGAAARELWRTRMYPFSHPHLRRDLPTSAPGPAPITACVGVSTGDAAGTTLREGAQGMFALVMQPIHASLNFTELQRCGCASKEGVQGVLNKVSQRVVWACSKRCTCR